MYLEHFLHVWPLIHAFQTLTYLIFIFLSERNCIVILIFIEDKMETLNNFLKGLFLPLRANFTEAETYIHTQTQKPTDPMYTLTKIQPTRTRHPACP